MKQIMMALMILNVNVCVYAMEEESDEEYERPLTVSSMVKVICDQKNLLEQERTKLLGQEAVIQDFINLLREKEETIEALTLANAQMTLDTESQDRKVSSLKSKLRAAHECIRRITETMEQAGDDKSPVTEQIQQEIARFWATRIHNFSRSSRAEFRDSAKES